MQIAAIEEVIGAVNMNADNLVEFLVQQFDGDTEATT